MKRTVPKVGSAHDNMNRVMGAADEEDLDPQDAIIAAMESRKMKGNVSYLAFTATPKPITLEKFGVRVPASGEEEKDTFKPFHLYSMKQAIEERIYSRCFGKLYYL